MAILRLVGYDDTKKRILRFDDTGYAELKVVSGEGLKLYDGAGSVVLLQADDDGSFGIGRAGYSTQINGYIDIPEQSSPGASASGEARIYMDSADSKLKVSEDGGTAYEVGSGVSSDGEVYISARKFEAISGTHSYTYSNGYWTMLRSAYASNTSMGAPTSLELQSTASRGKKITSVDLIYNITKANMDDVTLALYRVIPPTDGNQQTASSVSFTYDASHDTAAERGGQAYHTLTATIASGGVWLNSGEDLTIQVNVDGDAGPTGLFYLYGAVVHFDRNE